MDAPSSWARLARAAAPAAPAAGSREDAVLAALRRGPGFYGALARLKRWTRERFALRADEAVSVGEQQGAFPGAPPLETVVEFTGRDGTRHRFRVFKPAVDVREEDLPPAWMKDALAVAEGYDCDCC